MIISVEEKKKEAVKRLKMLKVHENVIKDFESGTINQSERGGLLYWLDEEQKRMVEAFEKEHNAVVYHVIHQHTNIGEMLCFLQVSDHPEEWHYDIEDIEDGQTLAYVMNLTMPDCSEFGSIGIRPSIGGVERIW